MPAVNMGSSIVTAMPVMVNQVRTLYYVSLSTVSDFVPF
jgi:hypothetical protein